MRRRDEEDHRRRLDDSQLSVSHVLSLFLITVKSQVLCFSSNVQVCAGLSSRLQEYKSENAQLEELLVAEGVE